MRSVLVVGADSLIGRAVANSLREAGDQVVGTTRRAGGEARDGGTMFLDLADPDAIAKANLPHFDAAVICAAMARFTDCREQPDMARRVNVTSPALLASRLVAQGGRPILLSTSAVFDCLRPHARPERARAPRSAYGAFKAEAEEEVLRLGGTASVLRLTKVLDPGMPLLAGWIGSLQRGRAVTAFSDHTFSPLRVADVVRAVATILGDRAGGIYQVSGASDLSYADAARHVAGRLGVPLDLVQSTTAVEAGIAKSEVTPFTTLDSTRIEVLSNWRRPEPLDVLDEVFGPQLRQRTAAVA